MQCLLGYAERPAQLSFWALMMIKWALSRDSGHDKHVIVNAIIIIKKDLAKRSHSKWSSSDCPFFIRFHIYIFYHSFPLLYLLIRKIVLKNYDKDTSGFLSKYSPHTVCSVKILAATPPKCVLYFQASLSFLAFELPTSAYSSQSSNTSMASQPGHWPAFVALLSSCHHVLLPFPPGSWFLQSEY